MTEARKDNRQETLFLEKAKEALDRDAGSLDRETLDRLRAMRLRAVEAAEQPPGLLFRLPRWAKAGAFATVAAAVIVFFVWFQPPAKQDLALKNPEDFEIIVAKDNIDLYEDLDFYSWLADDEDAA